MVSSNHTILPLCSLFQLGDHAVPLLSLHLQHTSPYSFSSDGSASHFTEKNRSNQNWILYTVPPVLPSTYSTPLCTLSFPLTTINSYYWWKPIPPFVHRPHLLSSGAPGKPQQSVLPFSCISSVYLPPESFLSASLHVLFFSLFLKYLLALLPL